MTSLRYALLTDAERKILKFLVTDSRGQLPFEITLGKETHACTQNSYHTKTHRLSILLQLARKEGCGWFR